MPDMKEFLCTKSFGEYLYQKHLCPSRSNLSLLICLVPGHVDTGLFQSYLQSFKLWDSCRQPFLLSSGWFVQKSLLLPTDHQSSFFFHLILAPNEVSHFLPAFIIVLDEHSKQLSLLIFIWNICTSPEASYYVIILFFAELHPYRVHKIRY